MLTRIKIKGFRGIKNCEIIDLGKVNVFIGRNNSGKSSILDALCVARATFSDRLFDEPILHLLLRRKGIERGIYTLRSFWHNYLTKDNILIGLEFSNNISLNFEIRWVSDDRLYALLEDPGHNLPATISGGYTFQRGLNLSGGIFEHVGEGLQIVEGKYPEIYRFISEITLIDDYLARKLERLEAKVFTRIFEPRLDKKLMSILNQVYDINTEGLTNLSVSPSLEKYYVLTFLTPEAAIHLDELGDGAKYATVILSLCLLLENSALLIEEIESHQHIGAITKLLPYMLQISNERNVQLFLTTHSFEVIQALSRLSEKFDIRFFHIQRDKGEITIRQPPSIDVKLLLDLGVDLRNLEFYKKFIVLEGDNDVIFIRSLLERYGKSVNEVGYIIKAESKDFVKQVSASLLSTQKDVIVMMDYDDKKVEELLQSLSDTFKNRNYEIQTLQGNTLKIREGSTVTLVPMGLPDDEILKKAGITWHEMEDYCLKLIEIDEKPREWAGISIKELVKRAKEANIKGANKSSTALQLLASIKGVSYGDTITEIIKSASQKILEEIIPQALKKTIS